MHHTLVIISLLSIVLIGCDRPIDTPTTFQLSLAPSVGGLPINRGETYADARARGFRVDELRLILSDLYLITENNDSILLTETIFFDLVSPQVVMDGRDSSLMVSFEVPAGTYLGLVFGTGVPASRINGDPTVYDVFNHPLGAATSMHWSWASGYRFLSLDGRADTADNQVGPPTQGLTYHTGFNELYRTVEMTASKSHFVLEEGETVDFVIQLDVLDLFTDGTKILDLAKENTTPHSIGSVDPVQLETARFIMDNLAKRALKKVPF